MDNSTAEEIIVRLKGLRADMDYVGEQLVYTQAILGSFHPDPVLRDHCQNCLKIAVEACYSEASIKRIRDQYPVIDRTDFLRNLLAEAIQKLDTVAIKEQDPSFKELVDDCGAIPSEA
ncbi:hypothetical protein [Desulfobacter hydrogenophilus]|uniref:Competence protein ComFB n=1 Tax=Desulfobacter hydrogenophilus TaxID=2291 RepID=A0ABX5RH87_9BACT|nr:hypothetical protein [Desulfobacter hydrogenophilus]NDY74620.1 hypothetical protein [Desulfobacter hydrogenophilus]QBH14288.1 hypothetical protein EYB58_16020 [Desulfobacter hydrogenophilus]